MFGFKSHTIYEGEIKIKPVPNDRPEFKRVYTTTVGDGFRISIELKSWSYGRVDWSTLEQKNGKSIIFDAHRVADKIIDRELYPLVQPAVDKILSIDKEYIASNPSEFTDDKGQTWRRV